MIRVFTSLIWLASSVLFFLCTTYSFGQKIRKTSIVDASILYSLSSVEELSPVILVSLEIKQHNGKVQYTQGYRNGSFPWSRLQMDIKNGKFQPNGILEIDYAAAQQDSSRVMITIRDKRSPYFQKTFFIPIPHLTSLEVHYPENQPITYNNPLPLTIQGVFSNGRKTAPNHPFVYDHLVCTSPSIILENGQLRLQNSTIPVQEETFTLSYENNPDVQVTSRIPVRYVGTKSYVFSGRSGDNGTKGSRGSGSSSGNGESGSNGTNGTSGSNAPDVDVYIHPMTQENKDTVYLVECVVGIHHYKTLLELQPQTTIQIDCQGGAGGDGGTGGKGGSGADETDKQKPAYGGPGGAGGNGGNGGNGGTVTLHVPKDFAFLAKYVQISNAGGLGGAGGDGGSGGAGGIAKNSTIWQRLLTGRSGSNGPKGSTGSQGNPGKPLQVVFVDK